MNPDIEKSPHRWGFKDTQFTVKNNKTFFKNSRYPFMRNSILPNFFPFVEEVLDIENITAVKNEEVEIKKINSPVNNLAFLKAIRSKFKEKNYTQDDDDRLVHSHGQMTTDEVYHLLYYGSLERNVDLVFYPQLEKDIELLVKFAGDHDVCLVPYGGGTSVSGALLLDKNEKRMIVSVDMRFMNKVLKIDKKNLFAVIEAGIVGRHLEDQLNAAGYTMGHEPDSAEFSTLGGWIATNASGMKRNKYGNIEEIVKSYRMVTPSGIIENKNAFDRSSVGIDIKKMLFGNEGNLGIITQATVKIHHFPQVKKFGGVMFPNFESGTNFLRELSNTNFMSASVRLVDNVQFRFGYALKEAESNPLTAFSDALKKIFLLKIKKFDPKKMCLLTLVFEGNSDEVTYQFKNNIALAKKHGGVYAGESNGKRGYVLTNLIAYIRDFLSDYFVIGETFETTVPWDNIEKVCQAAKKELLKRHKENKLPGKPFISWRVTQLYHSDVCIYFTMGIYLKGVKNEDKVYSKMEKQIRQAIIDNGGSISHHHGVGKIRQSFLNDSYSDTEINLLKNIKNSLDPKNVFAIGNNVFGEVKKKSSAKKPVIKKSTPKNQKPQKAKK